MFRSISIVVVVSLLWACGSSPTRMTVMPLQTGEGRTSDGLSMRYTDDAAVVVVRHRTGIGRAELRRTRGAWPQEVVVRLERFGRVEGFEATAVDARGRVVMQASLGRGLTLEPWPRGGGYAVRLPRAVLDSRVYRVRMQWVDYYRR